MIPKIIHWCWLSDDPIPANLQKCMDSWKVYLSDYEFVHWDFNRFPRGTSQWVDEAFDHKMYAFAADYIRLYALYNYGGIYLDMDVEVLKPFDPLLAQNTLLCWQNEMPGIEAAVLGVEKNSPWIKACLDRYEGRSFIKPSGDFDTRVLPIIIERCLKKKGFLLESVDNVEFLGNSRTQTIKVLPYRFFSPKSYKSGKICVSEDTYTIHHFAGSWITTPEYELKESRFWKHLGLPNLNICAKVYWRLYKPIVDLFDRD